MDSTIQSHTATCRLFATHVEIDLNTAAVYNKSTKELPPIELCVFSIVADVNISKINQAEEHEYSDDHDIELKIRDTGEFYLDFSKSTTYNAESGQIFICNPVVEIIYQNTLVDKIEIEQVHQFRRNKIVGLGTDMIEKVEIHNDIVCCSEISSIVGIYISNPGNDSRFNIWSSDGRIITTIKPNGINLPRLIDIDSMCEFGAHIQPIEDVDHDIIYTLICQCDYDV